MVADVLADLLGFLRVAFLIVADSGQRIVGKVLSQIVNLMILGG